MKLTCVQFAPVFGNRDKNVETMLQYTGGTDCDIILFPELCTSGYFFLSAEEALRQSIPLNSDVIDVFAREAMVMDRIICFGFPENDNGKVYNSAAILFPNPKYNRVYRKTHMFYKEKFCFEQGNTGFFVVDYKEKDIKIGPMICYDWRFPEAARSLALDGADLIVCPSNLVTNVWHSVMPTRALENKVYLAVANRCGTEQRGDETLFFNGGSAIYHYSGQELEKAPVESDTVISAEIFPGETRNKSFNEFNDIFRDRKPEYYSVILNNGQ